MLNKVSAFLQSQKLISPGDTVVCAVSGGADSVALLFAMYLLREKLQISLSAAHFNHGLRGSESDRDQQFVQDFCSRYDIPLHLGSGNVTAGKKGLEAAARNARYDFLESLPGKIATAHTADDNAETVLMHLIRGTGLKGLGGIAPGRGRIIRPMLSVTRQEVLTFLQEYNLSYVEDSTNGSDEFLRNRLRHRVMPLLKEENPRLAENVSQMALRLREDEKILETLISDGLPNVDTLRQLPQGLRHRYLRGFLEKSGVVEPEAEHVLLAESLVLSDKPSAMAQFPGGVVISRSYGKLEKQQKTEPIRQRVLPCPGCVELPGVRIFCEKAEESVLQTDRFTVYPRGEVVVRSRKSGDTIRLYGGTKSLKALFIDKKIPASVRDTIPVVADDEGVLGVWGIGANLARTTGGDRPVQIRFEKERKDSNG